jgi:hypothetical protein
LAFPEGFAKQCSVVILERAFEVVYGLPLILIRLWLVDEEPHVE